MVPSLAGAQPFEHRTPAMGKAAISWQTTGSCAIRGKCCIGSPLPDCREEITDGFALRIEEEKQLVTKSSTKLIIDVHYSPKDTVFIR